VDETTAITLAEASGAFSLGAGKGAGRQANERTGRV